MSKQVYRHEKLLKDIGHESEEVRLSLGITRRNLATAIGTTEMTLQNFELGKIDSVCLLSAYINLDYEGGKRIKSLFGQNLYDDEKYTDIREFMEYLKKR